MISGAYHDNAGASRFMQCYLGDAPAKPFVGLVLTADEKPVGAVVINGYAHGNCYMTAAIWGPVGVPAARNVFAYCFEQLECNRITLHCKVSNARALKMVQRLGFKREGLCRAYFDGEDAIVLGLLRAEQRII